ncbi:MAG: hypothetical protein J5911_04700 [Clostridia bacterium]|nr:hypothetical protein [Clostridia bacterium]
MNVLYAKVALYAYAHLDALCAQIDEIVEKKAFSSSMNFSPALNQFEDIIGLTYQKQVVLSLKLCCMDALKGFNDREMLCLDYKYFRTCKKSEYEGLDTASRAYFRLQVRLAEKFAKNLEKAGFNDERFKSECMTMEFFREMLKRVKERENFSRKNKTAKEKAEIKALKEKIAKNAAHKKEKSSGRAALSA